MGTIRIMQSIAVTLVLTGTSLVCAAPANAADKAGDVLWKYRTQGSIWASLTTHDGTLYVGSDDHRLHAVDLATHQAKWTFRTGGVVRSQPAIADGLAYIASDDGFLYALHTQTGAQAWRFNLKSAGFERRLPADKTVFYDYLQSSPVVSEGRVYVGSASGHMHALDARTGKSIWSVGTDAAIRGNPTVDGGRLFFGSWDHGVYALDAKTGERIWRYDTKGIVQSTPAVGDGKVVVGSRSAKLFALDAGTGQETWSHVYRDGSWVESSAVYRDGVFFVGSSDSLKLSAFDANTGVEKWSFKTGGWSWATPVLAGDVAYIGGLSAFPYYFDGVTLQPGFFAVDVKTGQERWRFTPQPVEGYVTGGVMGSPVILDGTVYVGAVDGYIYALKE